MRPGHRALELALSLALALGADVGWSRIEVEGQTTGVEIEKLTDEAARADVLDALLARLVAPESGR